MVLGRQTAKRKGLFTIKVCPLLHSPLNFSSSQVTKLSIQTGVPSEYTRMIQLENTEEASKQSDTGGNKKV